MGFKVLEVGDPAWVRLIMSLPIERRDLHLDQRMLAPFMRTFGWQGGLAVSDVRDGYIIQPLLINNEGQLRHAYNFGGAVGAMDLVGAGDHFHALNDWARKSGVTNQFCTLNPFLIKHQLQLLAQTKVVPQYIKESVYIDLNNIKPRRRGTRYANKAQGAGVKVHAYPCNHENISDFYKMYTHIMDRTDAKEHWKFSLDFFLNFAKYVHPALMVATHQGVPEAASLVVYDQKYPVAYYHFTGSYNTYPELGINHMLLMASAELVRQQGARHLYLGGGVTPDDGVFTFKAGFSDLRLPVYQYRGVL